MPARQSTAQWNGGFKDGSGVVKIGEKTCEVPYSFLSRFENGQGTNPEELLAAAHAGCYSMALSVGLGKANYTPKHINTKATAHIESVDGGFAITLIELETEAEVPGIEEAKFLEIANATKDGCPVSKALAATKITLKAKLNSLV